MIKHIVLLKIKPEITSREIGKMYETLFQLKDLIPGIKSIFGGKNNSPEQKSKSYTESFIMEFEDGSARDVYLSHQKHKEFAETYILPIIDDIIVFDFEY